MSISTKFYEFSASSDGTEIGNIIGGVPHKLSGYIRQILISCSAGGGNYVSFQVRYFSNDSSVVNLICSVEKVSLPEFAGVDIDAPFDLKNSKTLGDLILYLKPEMDGIFTVRIDYEFDPR